VGLFGGNQRSYVEQGTRKDWADYYNRRLRLECWLTRGLVVLYIVWVLGLVVWGVHAFADCDGFSLEVGAGMHDPAFDGPEYITQNPLGIIEGRYTRGPVVFSLAHTSSLEGFPMVWDSAHEDGNGANVLSVRYRFGPFK